MDRASLSTASCVPDTDATSFKICVRLPRRSCGVTAVAVAACRQLPPTGTRIAAAGWASHALFDLAHRHSEGSRLPDWYPAVCAGYDLVVASHLARLA